MKIILIIKRFSKYGGVENYCYQFFSFLKKTGVQVQVFCGENCSDEFGEHIRVLGLLRPGRFLKLLGFWLRIKHLMQKLDDSCVTFAFTPLPGCDVVRSGGSHLDFLLKTIAAQPGWLARAKKSIQRALSPINYLQYFLDSHIYDPRYHSKYIAISSNVYKELRERYTLADDSLALIPNGVDTSRFSYAILQEERKRSKQHFGLTTDQQVLGFCSTNFELKGLRYVIEALPLLDPKTVLLVAGKRHPGRYIHLAQKLGVKNRVIFLGSVKDMVGFYAGLDVLVHPSFYDTFGNVVAESLAMGVPVLTTQFVGAKDLVRSGVNGYLADPKDTQSFAKAIMDTLVLGVQSFTSSVPDNAEIFKAYYELAQNVLKRKKC